MEYEGLHLLCLSYRKYWHYGENCHDSNNDDRGKSGDQDIGNNGNECATFNSKPLEIKKGMWMVVQKAR